MELARCTEMSDKFDDFDNVIHDIFPHLSIEINFLTNHESYHKATNSAKIFLRKKKEITYTSDPDDLREDARDNSQVRYIRC